ncbi:MAG TPA: ATP-binding cassette domain-containing protein, partial [Polyangiaceae bacterium]|nr:ATP-binding cassette domain-containing protein [Polyangiaceae bacterium]
MTAVSARRWLVPEVVQTSAMDCGPAALKCLLEGHGISVSYGRLREACQTSVDGTSIDVMEDVANQLGLEAEQIMLPLDHLLLPEALALPAIAVVRLPSGATHFVVAWRRHGRFVQLMDPGTGRRWTTTASFLREMYKHTMPVPAAMWRDFAGGDEFLGALRRRLQELGVGSIGERWIADANEDSGWRGHAVLDAAVRMVTSLVDAGGLDTGSEAQRLMDACLRRAREGEATDAVPASYWSVRPAPPSEDGDEQLFVSGAVVVRALGRRGTKPEEVKPLSDELVAALSEPETKPAHELWRLLRADGLLSPAIVAVALALAAFAVAVEALVFRGLLEVTRDLALGSQRLGAMVALGVFMIALLILEFPIAGAMLRMGRHLETRLRLAFLEKIPRLHDRYFQSRLTSDMAERSHAIHTVRHLPILAGHLLRSTFTLSVTVLALAWLDPKSALLALLVGVASVALPLASQRVLADRDLRFRTHAGALSRFYLDALLGLVPVRAHGAERAVRREHESLLTDWARAGFGLQRAVVLVEGLMLSSGFLLSAWLVIAYLGRASETGSLLLFVYWALALPVYGQQIGVVARQYPAERNRVLRLLEPLGAPEEEEDESAASDDSGEAAEVTLENVAVVAGGHTILEDITLGIAPKSHVAIVGRSGAGKSSLVGLLLGWHKPACGRVLVDGEPLAGARIDALRQRTVWLDPAVQLFHRSLFDNLRYGANDTSSLSAVLKAAHLEVVIERLPDGLQTALGEGGGLLSGGEGQRVRFGRALVRLAPRLVILDEPFRALDRAQRR